MSKTCSTCDIEKPHELFIFRYGKIQGQCKECRNAYIRRYKQERQDGTREKRVINVTNGGKVCIKCSVWKRLDEFQTRDTEHGYRSECLECKKQIMSEYNTNVYNETRRNRKKTDIQYRLLCNHRNYVYKCLTKFGLKNQSSIQYIGCTPEMLKLWLEFQFDPDMTWENYGTLWTIDHVLALSLFDLTKTDQVRFVFNWTNLQPSRDNFVKSNRIRLWEYFNVFISAHRFIKRNAIMSSGYQSMRESVYWLREKHSGMVITPVDNEKD